MDTIVDIKDLRHCYGTRTALDGVSFTISAGSFFGLLGPNGGGKTTLFRILTTMLAPTSGSASVCGLDVQRDQAQVRRKIGVVFQSPSLDIYLTARENLRHAGHLFGLSGPALESSIIESLERLHVADRADDLVKKLSGGLRRRVELAKCLLHKPEILILDEPSTGLDPAARNELWNELLSLRESTGATILLTTHFIEEADRCDQLAILDAGKLVSLGTPGELKSRIGGDCIRIATSEPKALSQKITASLSCPANLVDGEIHIETPDAASLVMRIMQQFSKEIREITIGKPTLADVFMLETGHRLDHSALGGEN